MTVCRSPRWPILLLAALLWHSAAAADDSDPLPWSAPAAASTCPVDRDSFLWLSRTSGDACMRYFAPGSLKHSKVAAVILSGDRDTLLERDPATIPNNSLSELRQRSERLSQDLQTPTILLARPGTYGSSGDHRLRRTLTGEFDPLNHALDALKQKFGIERFVLWGHSGGATAAAALLTLGRTDIGCAVMTSGAFDYEERLRLLNEWSGKPNPTSAQLRRIRRTYDPLEHVTSIVPDDRRMVHVVGDPRDRVTPFELQRRWVQALRLAGHRVSLHAVQGNAPDFHNLPESTVRRFVRQCVQSQTVNTFDR